MSNCAGWFGDKLRIRGEEVADAVALLTPGQEPITYAGLWAQIESVASAFAVAGLRPGDVAAVVMRDGPELLLVLLGLTSIATCAPLNPAMSESELKSHLADLEPRALIVETADCQAAAVARRLDIAVYEAAAVLRGLPRAAGTMRSGQPRSEDPAVLLYTSATTGKAKLVALTHLNLRAMAANTRGALGLSEKDRFLSMMPLFHLQGLMGSLSQLLAGGSVICTSGFDTEEFPHWFKQFRPTWYTAGPTLHNAILPVVKERPGLLLGAPLRFVRSIGAALPQGLMDGLENALKVPVLEGYGMTEAGTVTSNPPLSRGGKPGSVGRSTGVEVAIMGDSGDLLPPEREGQIVVRGPAVMKAYWKDAEATKNAFRNGWFLTGDVGRLDEGGFLFVTGRIKDFINRGGEKILPTEIEEVLTSHWAVAQAAAFGIPHPTLGEDTAVAVVLRPGATLSAKELRSFAATLLTPFKVPRRIFFVQAIPAGATGKPKRAALASRFAIARSEPSEAPSSPVEKKLAEIWSRMLNVERVGSHDDFFSLGGDSFAVAVLLTELEVEFNVERHLLDESDFLASPTIASLARILSESGPAPATQERDRKSPVVSLQPRGSRIPFFCFPGAMRILTIFGTLRRAWGRINPST